jgi:hypothetical protein
VIVLVLVLVAVLADWADEILPRISTTRTRRLLACRDALPTRTATITRTITRTRTGCPF